MCECNTNRINTSISTAAEIASNMMLSQEVLIWMAKQKAPNARRVIVSVEALHATSDTYVEAARQSRQF
jgi:hypothetical protein